MEKPDTTEIEIVLPYKWSDTAKNRFTLRVIVFSVILWMVVSVSISVVMAKMGYRGIIFDEIMVAVTVTTIGVLIFTFAYLSIQNGVSLRENVFESPINPITLSEALGVRIIKDDIQRLLEDASERIEYDIVKAFGESWNQELVFTEPGRIVTQHGDYLKLEWLDDYMRRAKITAIKNDLEI